MKFLYLYLFVIILVSCNSSHQPKEEKERIDFPEITIGEATQLASLPLQCITQEYPNKLGQVLASEEDLATPMELRPTFYGCFDWHSAVHGHWSLIALLKMHPDLPQNEEIKSKLKAHFTKLRIQQEIDFFLSEENSSFERTYGWAWLFQLATELKTWDDELGSELLQTLSPLVDVLEEKMIAFLPKLVYPIRVGEHTNTAFALSLTFDYAVVFNKTELLSLLKERANAFYLNDQACPIQWEPSGYDFLSPCLEEARLMSKVLLEEEFEIWLKQFLPELYQSDFHLDIAMVSDRTDGKLVHLDGLNFSRAWNLLVLAQQPKLQHLEQLANQHFVAAYPNLIGDSYEGSHWLGSFALYAIQKHDMK